MRDLRRFIATEGSYVPHEGYVPPWWWSVARAARYWHVHPEVMMSYPSVWIDVAAACLDIEQHAQEVSSSKSRR